MRPPHNHSVTLIELLVAIAILSMIALGFGGIHLFSQFQALTTDRRAKLQGEASYVLDHMGRYVQQATGDVNDTGIRSWSTDGFQVRIDSSGTPESYSDDTWVGWVHSGDYIYFCPNVFQGGGFSCSSSYEVLAYHPFQRYCCSSDAGLVYSFLTNATGVDVTLRLRWNVSPSVSISADNPEVVMRAQMYSRSASAN